MPRRSRTTRKPAVTVRLDPVRLARALNRRNAAVVIAVVFVLVIIALLDHGAGVLPVDDDWHRYHGQRFEVVRVIDGDTLDVRVPDGDSATTRIRLWGVDTPELARAGRPAEDWAKEAAEYARGRAEGRSVVLHLQSHRLRGGYGRLLAYVTLPEGVVLNEALISAGLSEHDDRWGHDRAGAYEDLEQAARRSGVGKWSD